ncbi:hypothetical protein GCK72_000580 [Caenorhabditis remanei]|uniref:Uncharacterized protein n=1 Tax=Caenorhabditis remanei TaxID=31234 RepID=A0A6A5HR32_CAERE|nr:hypothetical protein GCK72_000580 [Caenorhabditis remanei]KAF1768767.1 hypothetical protein GCK72_000580 [Caenorhabditis remanei]
MSREQLETAFSETIEKILEVAGNTTATFLPILGGKSIELTISGIEDYLKMMKELQQEYERPLTNCPMSPNDSMLIHRNRLARSSKSRFTFLRSSPEGARCDVSPMDIDRPNHSHIEAILEESTILDPSVLMDETTHQRGFLADVSDMNGTVRSRNPSFNFNYISPVSTDKSTRRSTISIRPINTTIDFDADVSSIHETSRTHSRTRSRIHAGHDEDQSILVMNADEMRTPRAYNNTIDLTGSDVTPISLKLWNVKLRPGSNRKIDNEIRNEIQRQLARDTVLNQ